MPKADKNYNLMAKEMSAADKLDSFPIVKAIALGRKDPVFFAEYFLGVRLHDKQKIWLWITTKTQIEKAYDLALAIGTPLPSLEDLLAHPFLKNILAPGNRFGKTVVTAFKHIWYCFYKIGATGGPEEILDTRYTTLNISPHTLQVDALYNYVVDIFADRFIFTDPETKKKVRNNCKIKNFLVDHRQTKRELVFSNNSKIKGMPTGEDQASGIAGTNYFYISYDECPQSLHLQEELAGKIQSRLIDTGGPLDLIGTPEVDKPSHTYYHRIVKYGLNLEKGFFTMLGGLVSNTFLGKEEKESTLESIRQTSPEKYRQVAFGDFIISGAKMFDSGAINRLWQGEYALPMGIGGRRYMLSADWGFSDTGDPTVFYVVDFTKLLDCLTQKIKEPKEPIYFIVYRESIKGGSPYDVLARARTLQDSFNDADFIHDSSSMGGVIIKKMLHELNMRHMHDFGMLRSPKDEMLFLLSRAMNYRRKTILDKDGKMKEEYIDFGKIRSYPIPELEEQLGNYKLDDKKIEQDEVMSLGMAIWYLEKKLANHITRVFDLNILANDPEDVLRVPGEKKESKVISINQNKIIRERVIG